MEVSPPDLRRLGKADRLDQVASAENKKTPKSGGPRTSLLRESNSRPFPYHARRIGAEECVAGQTEHRLSLKVDGRGSGRLTKACCKASSQRTALGQQVRQLPRLVRQLDPLRLELRATLAARLSAERCHQARLRWTPWKRQPRPRRQTGMGTCCRPRQLHETSTAKRISFESSMTRTRPR